MGSPHETSPVNSKADFKKARETLLQYGIDAFKQDLTEKEILTASGKIETKNNIFAQIISRERQNQPNFDVLFVPNREINDAHWQSEDPNWIGKASMSKHHKLGLINDLSWDTFNILTMGIENNVESKKKALHLLGNMHTQAIDYAAQELGISEDNVGLYFHCYPFNSVNALHLHLVDESKLGPTFHHLTFKNLSLLVAVDAIREELADLEPT